MGQDMDPTNPYDPPERQALEEQLYHDQQLQKADHQALEAIHHVQDAATAAGMSHGPDDERAAAYAKNEQNDAARVVRDQQNIDTWDHAHPGWQEHLDQYQPHADASSDQDTSGAADAAGYADTSGYGDAAGYGDPSGYGDAAAGYGDTSGGGDAAYADAADPYATADASGGDAAS